ncbi:MAG: hypothetical protein IKR42_00900 [Campylobacter sp.]|nr:hypothetical protein [Campylobacter sp.]
MKIVNSNSANQIKNEEIPSSYFDIKLSPWAKKIGSKKAEISCEVKNSHPAFAHKYFLNNGCECEIINFTTPLKSIFVGDIIEIIMPEYGVPSLHGNTLFRVSKVEFIYKQNYAVCAVEAKRWNY